MNSKINKKPSIFKKQLFISIVGTSLFSILGMGTFHFYMRANRIAGPGGPVHTMAGIMDQLLDKMTPQEAMAFIEKGEPEFSAHLVLVDSHGSVLVRSKKITPQAEQEFLREAHPEKHFEGANFIVQLRNHPDYYLASLAPGGFRGGPPIAPVIFVLTVSVLSAMFSFAVLVFYLQTNAEEIEQVISAIRQGNLKARFKVKKLDEIGELMTKFNEMAAEIEALVNRVQEGERSRNRVLQELGHDFRTPLASLKNCLETIARPQIGDDDKKELMTFSVNEVDYLSRLVDDLLFLARVDDPQYLSRGEQIDFGMLLLTEAEGLQLAQHRDNVYIKAESSVPENLKFFADPHLMRRLIRNAIGNALDFAKSEVVVKASYDAQSEQVHLVVQDDGPGLPAEILKSYGERRTSRAFESSRGKRISLGLGSVIIKAIVNVHQGKLSVDNLKDAQGQSAGAKLEMSFPLRNSAVS